MRSWACLVALWFVSHTDASHYTATFNVAAVDGEVKVHFTIDGPWNEDTEVVIRASDSEVQTFDTPTGTALLQRPTGEHLITAEIIDEVGNFIKAEGSLNVNLFKLEYHGGHLAYFLGMPPLGGLAGQQVSPPCEKEKKRRIVVSLRTADATRAEIMNTISALDQQTMKPDAVYLVAAEGEEVHVGSSPVHVLRSIRDWGAELTSLLPLLSLEQGCDTTLLIVDARAPPGNVMIARAIDAIMARNESLVVGDAGVVFPGCFGYQMELSPHQARLQAVGDVAEAWRGQRAHSLVDSRVVVFPRRLAYPDLVQALAKTHNIYGYIGWDALSVALEHLDTDRVVVDLASPTHPSVSATKFASVLRESIIQPMFRNNYWKIYGLFQDPVSLRVFPSFLEVYRAWYARNYDIRSSTMDTIIRVMEQQLDDDDTHREMVMLETGTAPMRGDCIFAGSATYVLDAMANFHGGTLYSVDLNAQAVAKVRAAVSDKTQVVVGDTLDYIRTLCNDGRKFNLVYLDSLDVTSWPDDREASAHHLKELAASFPLLGPGTLVVVDDTLPESIPNPDTLRGMLRNSDHKDIFGPRRHEKSVGKGSGVRRWMEEVLSAPRVVDGYQLGWLVPEDIEEWTQRHGGTARVQQMILDFL